MPNPPSTYRALFRFRAGEKPTETNLNAGLVDKIDVDLNTLLTQGTTLSNAIGNISLLSGTTLVNRINAISDTAGNLTKPSPEFSLLSGASLLKVSGSQFKILGQDVRSSFRVNGRIKITQQSSAQIIPVVAALALVGSDTVIDLNTDYALITEASITEVYKSHELDSSPVVDGGVDILPASITADRLAPGVGSSSTFASDVTVQKNQPGLHLIATTGVPFIDMYTQVATVANRRRLSLTLDLDNNLRLNRATDSFAYVDTVLTGNLVTGVFDFANGITLGSLGSPINSSGASAQSIVSDLNLTKLPLHIGVDTPTNPNHLVPKSYVDARGGAADLRIFVAGELIAANYVYFMFLNRSIQFTKLWIRLTNINPVGGSGVTVRVGIVGATVNNSNFITANVPSGGNLASSTTFNSAAGLVPYSGGGHSLNFDITTVGSTTPGTGLNIILEGNYV